MEFTARLATKEARILETEEIRKRFQGLAPSEDVTNKSVLIVGLGATGGMIATILAKLGFKDFFLQDFDIVEPANIGVQVFDWSHQGMLKTDAVTRILNMHGVTNVKKKTRRLATRSLIPSTNITVAALDNLEARKNLFAKWRHKRGTVPGSLYIDPRMALDEYEVWAVVDTKDPRYKIGTIGNYRAAVEGWELVDREARARGNCGVEGLPTTAAMAAAWTANMILYWSMGKAIPSHVRIHAMSGKAHFGPLLDGGRL